jgi:hypothetical protein
VGYVARYGREAGTRCVSFLHLHHCWRWIQHIVLFWVDRWLQGMSCLIKAVGPRIQKCRTVKEALTNRRWVRDIKGALTVQVLLDYLSLSLYLGAVAPSDPQRRARSIQMAAALSLRHQRIASSSVANMPFQVQGLLRMTKAPAKCKFFIWLVLHDRAWTAEGG